MDCSAPGSSVLHYLPEFAQTHVHWVGDAIPPSHPLLPPPPPALNLSQYQSLFQWVGLSHHDGLSIRASASASVLPMNIQRWFPLGSTGLFSLQSKRLSTVFSSTTVQKYQFFSTQPALWSNSHICTGLLENIALTIQNFVSKMKSLLFNTLSGFVIAFIPKSKHLLLSWL